MTRVARVLVIEDSKDIADLVAHYLKGAGYDATVTGNGSEGLGLARTAPPDAIILDLMLPGLDGLHVCQALRTEPKTAAIPIIMLTARGEESDRIRGLEFGADDYVTKPFSPKELVARVGALLRRISRPGAPGKVLKHGPLTIDIDKHLVEIDGENIRLTAKEFMLLRYLIEHRGRVLSRDQLLTDVWSYQYTGGTRTVDVHIRRLREKVPFLSSAIATVKQFGYKLEDPASSS
jgi:two-component system, OmpR family, alkaline phosphatase synthesis response regulator PhoP